MRDIEPMLRVVPGCNWPSLRVKEPPQGSDDMRLMSDLRQAPVSTPFRTARLAAGLEPALVLPSPTAKVFGNYLAMVQESADECTALDKNRRIQESCQESAKAAEGQRLKCLMINESWLRGWI